MKGWKVKTIKSKTNIIIIQSSRYFSFFVRQEKRFDIRSIIRLKLHSTLLSNKVFNFHLLWLFELEMFGIFISQQVENCQYKLPPLPFNFPFKLENLYIFYKNYKTILYIVYFHIPHIDLCQKYIYINLNK